MNVTYTESRRRWFSRLTADFDHGLLKNVNPPSDSIIVCHHGDPFDPMVESKPTHTFALFSPLYTFAKEMMKVVSSERCYFEVILGDRSQKPYFDIDIDTEKIKVTESDGLNLIAALKESILTDKRISESDILVFSSHGSTKYSYHVIVNNWCLPDSVSNKVYCYRIIDRIPDTCKMKSQIDRLVYTPGRQLRIFGNTKRGKNRFKILDGHNLKVSDKDYRFKFLSILLDSLVVNTTSCKVLEYTAPIRRVWDGDAELDLTLEEKTIINNLDFIKDDSFEVFEVRGRMILLKRKVATWCNVCNRNHEGDNPFLRFSPDSIKIMFDCRRSGGITNTVWTREILPLIILPSQSTIIENKDRVPVNTNFMKKFLGKR